jgi:hypothetical protein
MGREVKADEVVRVAREATAHNSGETVVSWVDAVDEVFVRMSSWPRMQEAMKGLTAAGYVVTERENDRNELIIRLPDLPDLRDRGKLETWLAAP